ncbi:MAG: SPOR domain-containing protein [Dysgonamonadaceae bacterium]|jgi:hypothetical protein|nr:SPOR domain-containing protein [Dysgonamonadaceae bacterium]
MLRIVSHLEHLLRIHDCVVVPQLGGFVLQVVPASYVEEEHLFYPMHKEIVFNPSLKHSDGLLPEEYMHAYGVSFQQAHRMVEEDVENIKTLLFKELKISLGNVGILSKGEEGVVVFQPGDSDFFSVSSYGLSPFQLKEWEALQQEKASLVLTGNQRTTYYIPIHRSIIRGVAATAAAVALFLMISTPVKEINPSSYTASFIPAEIAKTTNKAKSKTTNFTVAANPGKTKTTANPATASSSSASKNKAVKEEKRPMYYVIIGSVKTSRQADELIAKIDRTTLKHVNKITGNGKVRIYANKFSDKSKAEVYLAKIKQNTKYKDAWLWSK